MSKRHEYSDGINKATEPLRDPKIGAAVRDGLKTAGDAAKAFGAGIRNFSRKKAEDLKSKAPEAERAIREKLARTQYMRDKPGAVQAIAEAGGAVVKGLGTVVRGGELAGALIGAAGTGTVNSAEAAGGVAGGISEGLANFISGSADALLLTEADMKLLRAELIRLGERDHLAAQERIRQVNEAIRINQRSRVLDLLLVGGMTLSAIVAGSPVDPKVEQAFAIAYPNLAASGMTFSDAVANQSTEGLVGLLAGVKGKLFELHLVDHLNSGNLPDGLQADLAASPTQAGWDIQITDKQNGEVHELLQAKATESLSYVQEALETYPDIDVVTTTEVHALLTARGLAEQARDSGVANANLEEQLTQAADAGQGVDPSDYLPSGLAIAFITLSVLLSAKNLSAKELGQKVGSRSSQAAVAAAAGKAAMAATQVWLIAFAAGIGSHWLATGGRNKRLRLEALGESLSIMQKKVARDAKARAADATHTRPAT